MNEKTITQNQLFFVIIQAQIGIGFLSLPYNAHHYAKSDSWISVIMAGVCIQIFILLIWLLMREHKGKTIFEISKTVLGKYVGSIINTAYILYGVMVMSLVLVLFGDLIERWILETTPKAVTLLLILTAGIYLGKQNLRVIARFFTIVNVILIVLFVVSLFTFSQNLSFTNLLPIGHTGFKPIVLGAHEVIVSLLGFEIILIILPLTQGIEFRSYKRVAWANVAVILFYLYFSILSLVIFSPKEIAIIPEPVLYMLKGLSFRLIERVDMIVLSYWIFPMMTSCVVYLYIASMGAAKLFHKGKRKYPVWYLSILVYGIALIPSSEKEIQAFGKYVSLASYIFIAVIPLILLALSLILKKFKTRSFSS
ncbi:endospore germination permease [Bacillus sp. CGMCC 1.16607]|uniref:GerAB/ArcD/ProY family transporter n=1 Tax=Bacillus sp. CGMCC 1.16607 TaxID=3351842 RepID=UPI0036424591